MIVTIGKAHGHFRGLWRWGFLVPLCFFVPFGLIAWFIGPELPTLGGALVGVLLFSFVLVRHRHRHRYQPVGGSADGAGDVVTHPRPDARDVVTADLSVLRAAAPYLVLVLVLLLTRLIPPLRELLQAIVLAWELPAGFSGSVQTFYHPAMLLTESFVVGAIIQRASWRRVRVAFVTATLQLGPVIVALIAMITVARTTS